MRDYETQQPYNILKNNTHSLNITMYEILLCALFTQCTPYTVKRNKFPYKNNHNEHYVIWINPKYDRFYTWNRVNYIAKSLFANRKFLLFENTISLKSIPEILHFHLLLSPI
jgi:hypothetical protein